MKKYEKPRLMALSLSGNDMLCSCAIDAVGDNMDPLIQRLIEGMANPFTADSDCVEQVDGYCKFTFSEDPNNGVIFNS